MMAVEERGYSLQLGPARSTGAPMADANDFGAQVGQAIGQVGDALGRYKEVERKVQADQESADISVKIEQWKTDTEAKELDAQTNPESGVQPGGVGYRAIVTQFAKERADALTQGVKDPRIKNATRERVAAYLGDLDHRADIYERTQGIIKSRADVGQYVSIGNARAARSTDLNVIYEIIADRYDFVDSQQLFNPEQREAARREVEASAWESFFSGEYGKANPTVARKTLQDGRFDHLPDDVRERIAQRLDVYETRGEALKKVAEREAAARQADAEAAILTQVSRGEDVDPTVVAAIVRRRTAAGDLSGAETAKASVAQAEVNAAFPDDAIPEMEAVIASLAGKRDQGSVLRLQALRTRLASAQSAKPVYPPIDFADPAQVRGQIRAAERDAKLKGKTVPDYLSERQTENIKALMQQGAQGRAEAIDQIAAFGGWRARAAARQVAGDDLFLQTLVTLPQGHRILASGGAVALKANSELVPEKDARADFDRRASLVLSEMDDTYTAGVFQVARAIAARKMADTGSADWDQSIWEDSVHMALGGTWVGREKLGGIGEWSDDTPFRLPDGVSQRTFDSVFNGITRPLDAFARGRRLTTPEIRENYSPRAIAGGAVIVVDAYNRALMKKDGVTPWTFDALTEARPDAAKRDAAHTGNSGGLDASFRRGDGVLTRMMRGER